MIKNEKPDASAIICKISSNLTTIETYYDGEDYDPPRIVVKNNRSIGLFDIKVSMNNGILTCYLKRLMNISALSDKFFDLNNLYYLQVAQGPLTGRFN